MYNQPMFANSWTPQGKKFVDIFLRLFPVQFLETVINEATSRVMLSNGLVRTRLGEMLQYIGMMLLMSCYMKSPDFFWRPATRTPGSEDEENDTPSFTFNRYMSWRRYLGITSALRFTMLAPPTFRDKFCEIRDLIESWNALMKDVFVAAWALCHRCVVVVSLCCRHCHRRRRHRRRHHHCHRRYRLLASLSLSLLSLSSL
jgi:hypothetical protein